jgi:predicted transport protein
LADALKAHTNLETLYLNLYVNNIGIEGSEAISGPLGHLKNLKSLHLELFFNNITHMGVYHVAEAIGNLT